jgi:hypothetical protein
LFFWALFFFFLLSYVLASWFSFCLILLLLSRIIFISWGYSLFRCDWFWPLLNDFILSLFFYFIKKFKARKNIFFLHEWMTVCASSVLYSRQHMSPIYTYTKNDQTKIDPRWQQNSVLLGTLDLGCYLASTCTRGTRVVLRWRLICISVYIHICVLPRVYWINDVHSPAAAVWS